MDTDNPRSGRRRGSLMLVVLVGLLAFVMVIRQSAPRPQVFENSPTLAQASSAAEATGMPVLVFATADWCGPCKALKRGALANKTVQDWIQLNTHPVYLDCTESVPSEASHLPITGFPTLMLLRDGRPVASVVGAVDAPELIAWFEQNCGALNDEKARAQKPGGG